MIFILYLQIKMIDMQICEGNKEFLFGDSFCVSVILVIMEVNICMMRRFYQSEVWGFFINRKVIDQFIKIKDFEKFYKFDGEIKIYLIFCRSLIIEFYYFNEKIGLV